MPDKWYGCSCTGCLRCWRNKLIHGCPQSKKWVAAHPEVLEPYYTEEVPRQMCKLRRRCYDENWDPQVRPPKRIASKNSRRARWEDDRITCASS